jgi:hypothetical protein
MPKISQLPIKETPTNYAKLVGVDEGETVQIPINQVIHVTYAELKDLRGYRELIPGMFYRITDYECTTSQEGTRAMNHRFDIIVQALSEGRLSEIAKAYYHSEGGDEYFQGNNANLSAWEIKYCLDNDNTRFTWACGNEQTLTFGSDIQPFHTGAILRRCPDMYFSGTDDNYPYAWSTDEIIDNGATDSRDYLWTATENVTDSTDILIYTNDWEEYFLDDFCNINPTGKGVIYYMKDEHGNECSYDFKNIQFKRYVSYDSEGFLSLVMEGDEEFWAYTFCGTAVDSDGNQTDGLDGSTAGYWGVPNIYDQYPFHHNVIKPQWYDDNLCENNKLRLNNIVLQGVWHNNDNGVDYSDCSYDNVFEDDCYDITLGYGCYNNHFGTWNYHITVGRWCGFNEFEMTCSDAHLGECVAHCYFGDSMVGVNLSPYCSEIRLGKYTYEISIDEECNHITIGESGSEIGIGPYSQYINIGDNCSVINTGESVHHITLGDECYDITLGEGSHHITFGRNGGETSIGDYSNWMTFGDGCQCNYFKGECSEIVLGRDCYNNHFCDNTHIYLDDHCCDNAIEAYTERIHLRSFICNGDFGESGPAEGLAIYTFQGLEERRVGE